MHRRLRGGARARRRAARSAGISVSGDLPGGSEPPRAGFAPGPRGGEQVLDANHARILLLGAKLGLREIDGIKESLGCRSEAERTALDS